MPRVKVTGNGEIEEVVRGKVYKIRHHLGKDPETGRYRRSPKRTVYGTKSKAREELAKYKIELEGGHGNPDKVTLGEYAKEWFRRRELSDRYSPETIKTDRRHLRRIVEMFGGALVEFQFQANGARSTRRFSESRSGRRGPSRRASAPHGRPCSR